MTLVSKWRTFISFQNYEFIFQYSHNLMLQIFKKYSILQFILSMKKISSLLLIQFQTATSNFGIWWKILTFECTFFILKTSMIPDWNVMKSVQQPWIWAPSIDCDITCIVVMHENVLLGFILQMRCLGAHQVA